MPTSLLQEGLFTINLSQIAIAEIITLFLFGGSIHLSYYALVNQRLKSSSGLRDHYVNFLASEWLCLILHVVWIVIAPDDIWIWICFEIQHIAGSLIQLKFRIQLTSFMIETLHYPSFVGYLVLCVPFLLRLGLVAVMAVRISTSDAAFQINSLMACESISLLYDVVIVRFCDLVLSQDKKPGLFDLVNELLHPNDLVPLAGLLIGWILLLIGTIWERHGYLSSETATRDLPPVAAGWASDSVVQHGWFIQQNMDTFQDLQDVDERIAQFQTDPYVKEALDKGLTLRDVATKVDEELLQVEQSIVFDYLLEVGNVLDLNSLMDDMDSLLSSMEETLGGYKKNIGKMNQDIALIQEESKLLDTKLSNRKKAFGLSMELLEGITISPDLIKKIAEAEINEFFIGNLHELDAKLKYIIKHQDKGVKAFHNVVPELERLRLKAVDRIREFFLKKIDSFRAQNTNIPLIQQNVFLKYRELFWFLMDHYTPVGVEVHQTYIGYVSTYFLQAFERYHKALSQLQSTGVDKNDLIGIDEAAKRGLFGAKSLKDSSNIYGLADRLDVLTTKEAGIIVPDHAREGGKKFPYEALFKSLTRLLIDNASSEFVFTCEFFSDPQNPTSQDSLNSFFSQVFEPTLKFVENTIRAYIDSTYDAIGLLFCIRVNTQNIRIMQKRRLPHLENFLNLLNILLWPRFQSIMGFHIDSLKKADPKKLVTSREPAVHYIVRRYAEFAASIITLNQSYDDALLLNSLSRLRSELESLMYRLAAEYPDKKTALAFWINNLDLVILTMNEHSSPDFDSERAFFETLLEQKTEEFVGYQLTPHIGNLIEALPRLEKDPQKAIKEVLEKLAVDFNTNWKPSIEKIHEDLTKVFPNFKNGAHVLHATLAALVLYYKRFLTVWDVACKGVKTKVVPIGIQTVLVEIKKYRSQF
ncbi:Vacuolar protein sorting-associated protein 52 [Kappamyces sp. JEL0829]|nr:Vacuolar protein sorting-associated protein 52 [Kappamyces sp. JEL0829]